MRDINPVIGQLIENLLIGIPGKKLVEWSQQWDGVLKETRSGEGGRTNIWSLVHLLTPRALGFFGLFLATGWIQMVELL